MRDSARSAATTERDGARRPPPDRTPTLKGGDEVRTNAIDKKSWQVLERLLTVENALCVEVMLRSGLRVSDVLSIRTEQLRGTCFTVEESKTGKRKTVRLPRALLERLRGIAGDVYVWEHAKDRTRHRTRQAVWADIKRAAKAMRIKLVVAPHSARKSYACELYRRTGDVEAVRQRLSHDRLEVTVLYLLDEFNKRL